MKRSVVIIFLLLIILGLGGLFLITRPVDRETEVPKTAPPLNTQVDTPRQMRNPRYVMYSSEAFEASNQKKRVYFFHAPWCPTCKAANTEFEENLNKIPENVVLFKTDYDTNSELKKIYGITYQHTFVYVDTNGREIKKWNGGAIDDLIANTQ